MYGASGVTNLVNEGKGLKCAFVGHTGGLRMILTAKNQITAQQR
jgi:hypothetical protein